jgi:hypothetical protein
MRLEAAREPQGAKTEVSTLAQELPPEMSAEEWEKKREKTRVMFDEFKKSLRGERETVQYQLGNNLVNEFR